MPGMTTAPESEPWVVTGFEDFSLQEFPSLIAVALYYAGDLPVAEVAAVLGVPEGTVRSDLTGAREALRPMLEA